MPAGNSVRAAWRLCGDLCARTLEGDLLLWCVSGTGMRGQPTDPVTFATVVVLFFAIVAAASWLPAHRAARLDPIDALQE